MEVNTMAHFWIMLQVNFLWAVGFAESIDVEMRGLKKPGIKTTIVCPYFINTGMFDGIKTKILPKKTVFLLQDYFGAYQSMDYFHGRLKKD